MSGKLSVTARQRRTGMVYDVYFWHAGDRIRFTISDASSYADAHERAKQIQEGVLAGRLASPAEATATVSIRHIRLVQADV